MILILVLAYWFFVKPKNILFSGTILDLKEQQYLMNALFACKESMICPFNKKTYVKLEYGQIDNMFK